MSLTSTALRLAMFAGQIVMTLFYGTLGTFATFALFVRLGRADFFKRVKRPTPPAVSTDPIYGKHEMKKLKSSNVTLHYVSKGSSDQPLMLFVHGFPECWYAWRYQMKYFSKNYRVVAIDQRGYGLSSKPPRVADYKLEILVQDIIDVIEQLGYDKCVLVGHDWGGVVAWATAILQPRYVSKLIIMNSPHLAAFRRSLTIRQLRRSWYISFFQLPYVPELLFEANDYQLLKASFTKRPMGLVNSGNLTPEDLETIVYTFAQPGTTTSAINYYRALARHPNEQAFGRVTVPVLVIWGCLDGALGEHIAEANMKYCDDGELKKVPNASHWVQQDAPDEVNKYMESFLNRRSSS